MIPSPILLNGDFRDPMTTKLQYTSENLLVLPENNKEDPDRILSITPEKAGWELISFEVRRLKEGQNWSFKTADNELVIVNLSGQYSVLSNLGEWTTKWFKNMFKHILGDKVWVI